jgi:DNA-binding CsgD family transcriptional regulator
MRKRNVQCIHVCALASHPARPGSRPADGALVESNSVTEAGGTNHAGRNTIVRRLALAKLRELRRMGLSLREIGRRYALPGGETVTGARYPYRLPAERLLGIEASPGSAPAKTPDGAIFLRALDALDHPLAFFCPDGRLLHANRALEQQLGEPVIGEHLRRELDHFALTLTGLLRIRAVPSEQTVEELDVRDVPVAESHVRIKGSYVGLDLFGTGGSMLVTVETPPADPLSTESLRVRFGLTRQEARIARLLVEGRLNGEIARAISISPHTARHHTEKIMRKLHLRSRAEVAGRILQRT